MADKSVPALLVSPARSLPQAKQTQGGVQICTAEYIDILKAAGFDLFVEPSDLTGTIAQRIRRKLSSRPYQLPLSQQILNGILERIETTRSRFVFLNLVDLAPMAKILRDRFGSHCKIVLLSHGAHSTDEIHSIHFRSFEQRDVAARPSDERRLGAELLAEREQRRHIDHVFCLSELDLALERWIGAKAATWLPRLIPEAPVDWQPESGRIGFVGTLDHPPNIEGLLLVLKVLARSKSSKTAVRIVGGPQSAGEKIARTFSSFVSYLGPLENVALRKEAATWCCAAHPMFCYGRGCSTKLAVLLSWQIPVLTTPAGRRGYVWREGTLPEADSPEDFSALVLKMEDFQRAASIREEVVKIVRSSPGIGEVAAIVKRALQPITVP